jgi:protein SCO1
MVVLMRRTRIITAALAALLTAGVFAGRAIADPPRFDSGGVSDSGGTMNVLPSLLQGVRIDQNLNAQVPADLQFIDENGKAVTLGDYFGKRPIILTLVQFECKGLCTRVLNDLCIALNSCTLEPGRDYDLLTISFDPREGPDMAMAKKKAYLDIIRKTSAAGSWHFLTGKPDAIKAITDVVGFHYKYDAAHDQYVHASGIMIMTPDGRLSRYFYGIEYSPNDIRLAVAEAGMNKIGSLADEILLYCCPFDIYSGHYTLAVTRLLRVFGGLTLAVLGGFLCMQFMRDRRRPAAAGPNT